MRLIKSAINILLFLVLVFSLTTVVAADNIHSDLKWSFTCSTCTEDNLIIPYDKLVQYNMDLPYRIIIGTSYDNGILCSKVTGKVDVFKLKEKGYEYVETIKFIDVAYSQGYNSGSVYFNENFDSYLNEGAGKYYLRLTVKKEYFTEQYCRIGKVSEKTEEHRVHALFTEENNPTIEIISPEQRVYDYQDIEVRIEGSDGSEHTEIFYSIDNTNYNIEYNGIETRTFSEGQHTLYAMAIDPSGNRAYDQVTFTVDLPDPQGPTINIISPEDGETYDYENIPIEIEATDDNSNPTVTYTIDGSTEYTYSGIITHTFSEGQHTIEAKAVDSDGLEAYDQVTFTVDLGSNQQDTTPPNANIIINNGEPTTTSRNVVLNLEYSDDDSGVNACRYGQYVDSTTKGITGSITKFIAGLLPKKISSAFNIINAELIWTSWQTCTPTKEWVLTEGEGIKTVYYQVRDNAGNIAQATDSIELISNGNGDGLQVEFNAYPIEGYAPLKVRFSANIVQGTPNHEGYTYELIMGDGEAGEVETQQKLFQMDYIYKNSGIYHAVMNVCDKNECVSHEFVIRVYKKSQEDEEENETEIFYDYHQLHIDNIVIEGINSGSEYMKEDDTLRVFVKMTNYGSKLENLKTVILVDELGEFMPSGNFDLGNGETTVKIIELPLTYAKKGTYDIRIVVSNEEIRRVKYRQFKVV